ncbi:MAG: PRC-barrel domain-containing protein [Burkholderiaceae bacterium]|nr:PRC-barrel domain-containing protein [Burkholderiaceae bacterium]
MLQSVKELDGYELAARDGDIGRVREVYFDDQRWVIRHLVVDTGGWLSGRDVLVSPHSIDGIDRVSRRLDVALSREKIENAPGIGADKPVARQNEIPFYDYYGYPYYWAGPGLWGAGAYPLAAGALGAPPPDAGVPREIAERAAAEREKADPHLRSSGEVIGYHIEARDDSIGHVEDLLFDERSWQIRYAVVDTRNWLPGRLVLVTPQSIESVDWNERQVHVRLTRDAVKASPEYEPGAPLPADYDQRVQRYYEDWRRIAPE